MIMRDTDIEEPVVERVRGLIFRKASILALQRGQKTQSRRLAKHVAVTLPKTVTSDLPGIIMPVLVARPGRYFVTLNPQGAVSALLEGKKLGLRPGEFHFHCPLIPDGETSLHSETGWTVRPREGQAKVWVRETWRTFEDPTTGVDGVIYAEDGQFRPIQNTAAAADAWVEAHDNNSWGDKLRSPIFMPRWASRYDLWVTRGRLQRLQGITDEDAVAEGCVFTDYGRDRYGQQRAGWSYGPSTDTTQCLGSARMAFANAWNVTHAGPNWNLKAGPAPWDQNPWVWAYTFARAATVPGGSHG